MTLSATVAWIWCLYGSGTIGQTRTALPPVPVPVVAFLDGLSTGQEGFARYTPRTATLQGRRIENTLVTEVTNLRPGEQVTSLILPLQGEFERLQATVGRDDREAQSGLAYVYFEVWGDDALLYRSPALGASRSPGGMNAGGQPALRTPQEVNVSVSGIHQLRLTTRYASDLPQRGGRLERARGCLWANARLTPMGRRVGVGPADPIRDALRIAAVRLSGRILQSLRGTTDDLRRFPLTVGIAPLREPAVEGRSDAGEPAIRAALAELLTATRRTEGAVFQAVGRTEARVLTQTFRSNRIAADETAQLQEAGRKVRADIMVTGGFVVGAQGRIELIAVDTRDDRPPITIEVPLVRSVEDTTAATPTPGKGSDPQNPPSNQAMKRGP